MTDESVPVSERSTARVATYVRQGLLDGRYSSGDRLPSERDLCAVIGVSRSVLREGLRALAALGLVDVQHGRGTFISRPDLTILGEALALGFAQEAGVVDDVLQARIAIECQAIRLACRAVTDHDLATIGASLEAFVETLDDPERGGHADYAFHSAIVEASRSRALIAIYQAISPLLLRSHIERRRRAMPDKDVTGSLVQAHRDVFAALVTGEPDIAEAKIREHFEISARLRRNRFLSSPSSVPVRRSGRTTG